ncbi:MAG: BrnT family toxin [Leptolyngbyaceae bacterium]|nr:BrnT family toxin [Leptolyngbyaceae bacterium]
MQYNFEWDSVKERSNRQKHKLSFRQAATVFQDPNHISLYDEDHSQTEDRWITLGMDRSGILRVVIHTFEPVGSNQCDIRIISARTATKAEAQQYQETQ